LETNLLGGILTVWVITWRTIWPVIVVALLLVALAITRPGGFAAPPARAFLLILLPPLAVVAWGGANWDAPGSTTWRQVVLSGLAIAAAVSALFIAHRFRRSPRPALLVIAALPSLAFDFVAWAIGGMAIANVWL